MSRLSLETYPQPLPASAKGIPNSIREKQEKAEVVREEAKVRTKKPKAGRSKNKKQKKELKESKSKQEKTKAKQPKKKMEKTKAKQPKNKMEKPKAWQIILTSPPPMKGVQVGKMLHS